jgi:hypothetical protein
MLDQIVAVQIVAVHIITGTRVHLPQHTSDWVLAFLLAFPAAAPEVLLLFTAQQSALCICSVRCKDRLRCATANSCTPH